MAGVRLGQPHEKLLAMAVMHGARRRLKASLADHKDCKKLQRTVTTIDSFALDLVNKWRAARDILLPISASKHLTGFTERHFRSHAGFDEIVHIAAELLKSPCIIKLVSQSYPLIVIDEFQDCRGSQLELVKQLAESSQVLLAADDFQLLEAGDCVCPAVDWAKEKTSANGYIELTKPHRTANKSILRAAHCLRVNEGSAEETVAVRYGGAPQLAWKIIERLILGTSSQPRWVGSFAFISPSRDPIIKTVIDSVAKQVAKRNLRPIRWSQQTSQEEDERQLLKTLGLAGVLEAQADWQPTAEASGDHVSEVTAQVSRFAKLRGLRTVPAELAASFAQKIVHAHHAYPASPGRCTITTVHGAKNREFDYVFVLWPYSLHNDRGLQRRLLYNAITRAKRECMVFAIKKVALVKADTVLQLLGPPKPIFAPKPKRAQA